MDTRAGWVRFEDRWVESRAGWVHLRVRVGACVDVRWCWLSARTMKPQVNRYLGQRVRLV